MVDAEAGKRNPRKADGSSDKKHSKRCVTVDVAGRNQTNSGKDKTCNVYYSLASEFSHSFGVHVGR